MIKRSTNNADVNFYCDIQNCYGGPTGTKDIGLFTHVHADDINTVASTTYTLDHIFHMSTRYLEMFGFEKKYPVAKMSIMIPWEIPNEFKLKKPVLGIFQRGKYEGKGFHFILDFFKRHTELCKHFDWKFVGSDWEDAELLAKECGISCIRHTDKQAKYPIDYNYYYNQVDYVLIPSKWEGGPISLLEAYSKGIPVIAADVGWVSEFNDAKIFPVGNLSCLSFILTEIIGDILNRRRKIEGFSYKFCANQIIKVAKQ